MFKNKQTFVFPPHPFSNLKAKIKKLRAKNIIVLGLLILLITITFVSCNHSSSNSNISNTNISQAQTSEQAEVSETVNKCDPNKNHRVVSLSPTATEMLYEIGAAAVAVDDQSNYPTNAPSISGLSGFQPNVEAILEYNPNLVLTSSNRIEDEFSKLEGFDVCVLRLPAATSLEEIYNQIKMLGDILERRAEADQVISSLKKRVAEVIVDAPEVESLTYYYELDPTFYSVTDNTFIGVVLGLLNLNSIAKDTESDYPQLNPEAIFVANPDIIILADTKCCAQNAKTVSERQGWQNLDAVKQGKILELDDDIASRWSPRIVNLMEGIRDFLNENFK